MNTKSKLVRVVIDKRVSIREYSTQELALEIAAEECFQSEVIETDMQSILIGEFGDYASKEDWIEQRIKRWLEEAVERTSKKKKKLKGKKK